MTIPINIADADAEILKGSYGADKGQVEAGLTSDFNDLVVARVKKQMDDNNVADLTDKLQVATVDAKKDALKFLDFTPEQRAVAFAAVSLASNVATPDSIKP